MRKIKSFLPFICLFLFMTPASSFAIDGKDTRMLSQPVISADHIAFIYAEDLWVANTDGSQPRRLTVDEGIESNPVFSPDGRSIAFSAQYDGNIDVFIIAVEGGIPRRLTWHPGADIVRGFTKDGKSILFSSQRTAFTNRYAQLFTVSVKGGPATKLDIPNANFADYSPDGKWMAYTPLNDAFKQWKHYRGGSIANIWLFSFADNSALKIPQPEGGSNDTGPFWMDNKVYFRSDRNGEFNLFSYDVSSKEIRQLTQFKDFPVINATGGNGKIIFEQAGYLHTLEPGMTNSKKLTIGIGADLLELRPRFVKGARYIRSAELSPSGSRAVFDFRGDIVTVPAEKGDYRNLTLSTGVHEKYPSWSPDGRSIAYFSDASGEYQLHIKSQDGKGDPKIIKLTGTGFYAYPSWSPDSKKISYTDNGRDLFVVDVAGSAVKKIASDELYGPGAFRDMGSDWSYDSRWIAYTKVTETYFKKVFLYSLDQDRSFPITDGLSDASEPKFDRAGKFLTFFASTDAGPVINWFDQSNDDMRQTRSIYLVTLQNETISPFAKENDEEKVKIEKDTAADKKSPLLRIDWEGIQNRIIDIPVKAGNYGELNVGREELLYIDFQDGQGSGSLHKYSFKKRSDNEVMDLDHYVLSADGKKMLYVKGGNWAISNAGEKPEPGKGMLNIADIQVKIDPVAEWPEIFDEAWRVNRDYFYDPGMHGVNWEAMKKKYAVFLPDLACRNDLNILIQWMCSELSVGHHRITDPGDRLNRPLPIPGGLLGADYTITDNRYRIRKIYGGLNWNPNLRSPLTEPGVNVKEGDYILAVNGHELTGAEDIYQYFENTAGKIV